MQFSAGSREGHSVGNRSSGATTKGNSQAVFQQLETRSKFGPSSSGNSSLGLAGERTSGRHSFEPSGKGNSTNVGGNAGNSGKSGGSAGNSSNSGGSPSNSGGKSGGNSSRNRIFPQGDRQLGDQLHGGNTTKKIGVVPGVGGEQGKGTGGAISGVGGKGHKIDRHLNLNPAKGLGDFKQGGKGPDGGRVGHHDFRGGEAAHHEFQNWSGAWKGKKGDGHDHRDWSGKWKQGDRFNVAIAVRKDWHHGQHKNNLPFSSSWWKDDHDDHHHHHHVHWHAWDDCALRLGRPYYWWGWASCPVLVDWCHFGWSTPYYWDYGPGEYIYCLDGVIYVNGVWYQPAPVFYQQTLRLVESAPVVVPDVANQAQWLPLGVFAVTPDGANQVTVLVQLAVTKEGILSGTAFDQQANASYPIQGTVDKNTQRAVWSYTDGAKKRIVMETSVNNLTQAESTGLMHYGPNDLRVVEFVRLEDPAGGSAPTEQ
ncbi:MAG: hypothetical protein IT425_09350 [Pirellulales bacterium]|nr:hypothetical protein [Pirellulales bacterium]